MNQPYIKMARIVEEKAAALAKARERSEYWRALAREAVNALFFIAAIAGFCLILCMIFGDKK